MFLSEGQLEYSVVEGYHRLVVNVDPELHRYLRHQIPKTFSCQRPKFPPHITVVRGETPLTNKWNDHNGKTVSFSYDPYIHYKEPYWWINCWSKALTDIRLELGLPTSYHLSRPPDGTDCFHSTIGNSKRA